MSGYREVSVQAQFHDAHNLPHVVIELVDRTKEGLDKVESFIGKSLKIAKIVSGKQAFREYNWIKGAVKYNKAGNLRGMVINKQAKAAFDIVVEGGEKLEQFSKGLAIAAMAIELAKTQEKLIAIHKANVSDSDAAQQYITTVSMAILRSVTSPVPDGAHAASIVVNKVLGLVGAPTNWQSNVRAADVFVRTTYDKQWNADNVVHFINTHLVI